MHNDSPERERRFLDASIEQLVLQRFVELDDALQGLERVVTNDEAGQEDWNAQEAA